MNIKKIFYIFFAFFLSGSGFSVSASDHIINENNFKTRILDKIESKLIPSIDQRIWAAQKESEYQFYFKNTGKKPTEKPIWIQLITFPHEDGSISDHFEMFNVLDAIALEYQLTEKRKMSKENISRFIAMQKEEGAGVPNVQELKDAFAIRSEKEINDMNKCINNELPNEAKNLLIKLSAIDWMRPNKEVLTKENADYLDSLPDNQFPKKLKNPLVSFIRRTILNEESNFIFIVSPGFADALFNLLDEQICPPNYCVFPEKIEFTGEILSNVSLDGDILNGDKNDRSGIIRTIKTPCEWTKGKYESSPEDSTFHPRILPDSMQALEVVQETRRVAESRIGKKLWVNVGEKNRKRQICPSPQQKKVNLMKPKKKVYIRNPSVITSNNSWQSFFDLKKLIALFDFKGDPFLNSI